MNKIDYESAEDMIEHLARIVDHPLFEDSNRFVLSKTIAITSLHFAASVRVLCFNGLDLGVAAVLRSQFEAVVRSVWVFYCATDLQVEKLSSMLSIESQQINKNIPMISEMLAQLEKMPLLEKLNISLSEFKAYSMPALNSFVHSGIHAIHWTKYEPPPQLIEQLFRQSNGLAVIAFQGLSILTGSSTLQKEVIEASSYFSNCLNQPREST